MTYIKEFNEWKIDAYRELYDTLGSMTNCLRVREYFMFVLEEQQIVRIQDVVFHYLTFSCAAEWTESNIERSNR
jgi:hypothetical protein